MSARRLLSAAPRPGRRVQLAQRILLALAFACIAAAAASYVLDWHEYRSSDWSGLGCAFMVDCTPSEPVLGSLERDTGLDHGGAIILVLLALTAALSTTVLVARPQGLPGLLGACALVAAAGVSLVIGFAAGFLEHLFDHSRGLPAEAVFGIAELVLATCAIAILVLQALRYKYARQMARVQA